MKGGGAGAATRTLGLLEAAIMEYAAQAGYQADNPVRGVRQESDRKRNVRLDEAAYRRLGSRPPWRLSAPACVGKPSKLSA